MATPPTEYCIFDREAKSPYIAVLYATEQLAKQDLDGLLRPYPEGHAWRQRLYVAAAPERVAQHMKHRYSEDQRQKRSLAAKRRKPRLPKVQA
jgi:hypothetical protein